MEDIKFASATSEGEYRAKAAKIKLPMGGKKKFNNNNRFNNKPEKEEIKEQQPIQEEKLEIIDNPSNVAQDTMLEVQEEKDTKKKTARKGRTFCRITSTSG